MNPGRGAWEKRRKIGVGKCEGNGQSLLTLWKLAALLFFYRNLALDYITSTDSRYTWPRGTVT